MTTDIQGDGTARHRFVVNFSVEGTVEIDLPADASETEITKTARAEIWREFTKSRGCPWDIQIGMVDGPF